jgi:hypothetical protein
MKRRLLFLFLLGAAGCDRPSAHGVPSRESASASASIDTSPKPVLAATPPSRDTVSGHASPAISEACRAFAAIFSASAAAHAMSTADVGAPRDTVMNFGETAREPVEPACLVAWSDHVSREAPLDDVFARARAAGWTERDKLLLADGPDGSVLAVSRGNVACVVSGNWDGGDDGDSTYVPSPGFVIAASCFVNRPDRY